LLADAEAPSNVLVIDDDERVHDLMRELLLEAGYLCSAAKDGARGLELAIAEQPSVIVLDLIMPGLNGFEVATCLRQDPRTASIPIVVFTAKELTLQDRQLLMDVDGLLSKAPMDRRAILSTLRSLERRGRFAQ
jgi:CheY-like chemotaxis protein